MACRGMTLADTDPHDPQAGQAVYWQRFLMFSSFHFVLPPFIRCPSHIWVTVAIDTVTVAFVFWRTESYDAQALQVVKAFC